MLIDANLLIFARNEDSPRHKQAVAWLNAQFNGDERVGLPWPVLLAFQRIMTNPRLHPSPLRSDEAWDQVKEWLALPIVWTPAPTEGHAVILGDLIRATGATGNLVSDAHLAAIALEHGQTLYSDDSDFARFPGLRWVNPLTKG